METDLGGVFSFLMMGLIMKEIGKMIKCQIMEDWLSPIVTMKAILRMDLLMERGIMKILTKPIQESGGMISSMDLGNSNSRTKKKGTLDLLWVIGMKEKESWLMMSLFMKGSLKLDCLMVKEWSSTKMDKFSRDLSSKIKESLEDIPSLMDRITKAPSETICLMEMDNFTGQMGSSIQGSGKLDSNKVLEFKH